MQDVFIPHDHRLIVPPDVGFDAGAAATGTELADAKKKLETNSKRIAEAQQKLYADNRYSLLLIFQAMDAAGKDSTIRKVLSGTNPAGCQVFSFKQPSAEELDHDFLWRSAKRLPERGRIGVFNRSYYEEALVVRVHPEYLGSQQLPFYDPEQDTDKDPGDLFWEARFDSIRDHELHLARSGTVVLKFWLNVSLEEQKNRFLRRLHRPDKHWKFSSSDLKERQRWDDYMKAYSELLPATSKPWAPWFAIPADSKANMRALVSEIVAATLESLPLRWPEVSDEEAASFAEYRRSLESE